MDKIIKGQLTDGQFKSILAKKSIIDYNVDYVNSTAWVKYGKSIINYYAQHDDGSWTNVQCKTI